MAADIQIPREVADVLRYYVYALRDPRDGKVFYVGKGVGDRINSHAREAGADLLSRRAKLKTINEIELSGREVDLLFLRTGIEDEATAFKVEQAVIDAFAANHHPLTNLVRGHDSGAQGLATLQVVVSRYAALPTPPIPEPLILVKINRGWRSDMNDREVFEQARGHWKVGWDTRNRAEYALGVAWGVVRGVYRIDSWFPSEQPWDEGKNRWGFNGEPADELRHVISTHVRDAFKKGNQSSFRKFLEGYPGVPASGITQA